MGATTQSNTCHSWECPLYTRQHGFDPWTTQQCSVYFMNVFCVEISGSQFDHSSGHYAYATIAGHQSTHTDTVLLDRV